jgi:hypothetical protein
MCLSRYLLALVLPAVSAAAPTFSKEVAPIFHKHCVTCHRPGEVAPFSLVDFKSARPWAKAVREAVVTRKMPPWFADSKHGEFANDPRLSDHEIATVRSWVDAGAPEGDSKHMPTPPVFTDGWQLGNPDIVIDIGEDHQVTPGEDAYENFTVSTNFTEGKWVRAAEIRPGNRAVVHHVHVLLVRPDLRGMESASTRNMPSLSQFILREGKLSRIRMDAPVVNDACAAEAPQLPFLRGSQEGGLAAYLPGRPPDSFPDGTAKWIPAGSKLQFVIHYARISGPPQKDRTSVGLFLAPGKPERELRRMDLRNFFLKIPAGASNHEVKRCYDFESDKLLLSFTPHMHYRGKDITYEVVRPSGKREVLLHVPRYDFNWQLVYRLKQPVRIEKGSRLIVTAHYDNSPNNRFNPDPSADLRWGDKSEEEMMTSWIEYLDGSGSITVSSTAR